MTTLQSEEVAGGGGPEAGPSEPEARRRRELEQGRGAAAYGHGEVRSIRDCQIGDLGELLLGLAAIGLTGPLFLSHFHLAPLVSRRGRGGRPPPPAAMPLCSPEGRKIEGVLVVLLSR